VTKTPKPSPQEVADAIAYFRATSNRHDLTDILTAATGGAPEPEPAPEEAPEPDKGKPGLASRLHMKK
jgi:hypothetical protein